MSLNVVAADNMYECSNCKVQIPYEDKRRHVQGCSPSANIYYGTQRYKVVTDRNGDGMFVCKYCPYQTVNRGTFQVSAPTLLALP